MFLVMSFSFPIWSALHPFSRFFQVTSSKTFKIYLFGNVIIFLHNSWFPSDIAFFYIKHRKNTFSVILFSIPKEYCQNFGILVPMKMNNKKKIYFIFFSIKSFICGFQLFWYLKNLKTLIIHVSRNVLSIPKHKVLCMNLSVFINNMIKNSQNTCFW